MPTQNVNLTKELHEFVQSLVKKGEFNNASEVHRAALSTMVKFEEERQLRLQILKKELDRGIQDLSLIHI